MPAPLPLFPILPGDGAPAGGIAALAARAEPLAQPNTVHYAAIEARSLLTRCRSARVPFAWTINPYRGCEFACVYCYARYAHSFMELRAASDFERRIFVKARAAALLRHDLRRIRPGEQVAIGTATDPYQPAERRYRITRSILAVLAEQSGLELSLVSKSDLIVRDIDLLRQVAARNRLRLRLTITTTDAGMARALEPRAPRPDLRLRALARLRAAGLNAGVMCAPVLPGITDSRAALDRLMAAAAAAGAASFNAQALFVPPDSQATLFPFVRARFPQLWTRYERAYQRHVGAPRAYSDWLDARVVELRRRHGFRPPPECQPSAPGEQAEFEFTARAG